jgi:hypothetical protein
VDPVYKWMKDEQIVRNWLNEICDINDNVLTINLNFELQLKILVMIVSTCIVKN